MSPLTKVARLPRRMQIAIICIAIASSTFAGAGIYAVWNGQRQDSGICDAVNGLRRDLVQVITAQEDRALANVKKLGLDVEAAKRDYNNMLSKIGDEACP